MKTHTEVIPDWMSSLLVSAGNCQSAKLCTGLNSHPERTAKIAHGNTKGSGNMFLQQ